MSSAANASRGAYARVATAGHCDNQSRNTGRRRTCRNAIEYWEEWRLLPLSPRSYSPASPGKASAQGTAKPEKKYKDQGEYTVFNDVVKDVNGNNFTKAVTDLDAWTQKYPQTDFANERTYYYLRAYSGSNQPAKVLEIASQLMAKDIKATYSPFDALNIYALSAYSVRQLAERHPGTTGDRRERPPTKGWNSFLPTLSPPTSLPPPAKTSGTRRRRKWKATCARPCYS